MSINWLLHTSIQCVNLAIPTLSFVAIFVKSVGYEKMTCCSFSKGKGNLSTKGSLKCNSNWTIFQQLELWLGHHLYLCIKKGILLIGICCTPLHLYVLDIWPVDICWMGLQQNWCARHMQHNVASCASLVVKFRTKGMITHIR